MLLSIQHFYVSAVEIDLLKRISCRLSGRVSNPVVVHSPHYTASHSLVIEAVVGHVVDSSLSSSAVVENEWS